MPETTTTHYGWTKPEFQHSPTTWGTYINADLDAIDSLVYANQQKVGTVQAQLTANNLSLSSIPTTTTGVITFSNSAATAGQQTRWVMGEAATANPGGNVGSDFGLNAYSDAGAFLGNALSVNRATQIVTLAKNPVGALDAAPKQYVDACAAPVGSIVMWATATPPTGWTWATGTSLSRASYPALFAVLGTSFGAVDGNSFNLPQLGNRFVYGFSGSPAIGTTGGEATHTLVAGEMPVHTHPITDVIHAHNISQTPHAHGDPGHSHTITDVQHLHTMGGGYGGGIGPVTPPHPLNDGTAGINTGPSYSGINATNVAATGLQAQNANIAILASGTGLAGTGNAGGGAAHNTMPPYIVMGFIIRVV